MKKPHSKTLRHAYCFLKTSKNELKLVAAPTLMFVSFRLLMLALSVTESFKIWRGDYRWVKEILLPAFRMHGFWNVWTGYPPLTSMILYLVLPVLDYASLHLISMIFDTGNLLLIYGFGKRFFGTEKAIHFLWIYSCIFITIQWWIFPLVEQIATFFFLLSLYLMLLGKGKTSAISAGIGAMTKIFPGITILTYLKAHTSWRAKFGYVLTVCLISFIISLPFLLENPIIFISGFTWQANRPPWETLWAILTFGANLSTGIQPKYLEMIQPVAPNHKLTLIDLATLIGLFAALIFVMLKAKLTTDYDKVRFTTVILCVFFFWSKGYSPQYSVWLTPLLLLLYPDFRGLLLLIVWQAVNCLEYPYAFYYFYPALVIICILIRTIIFVGIIVTQTRYLTQALTSQIQL